MKRPICTSAASLLALSIALCIAACHSGNPPKKPDPTKGSVSGIVLCADTGKPARFAAVSLLPAPAKDAKPGESAAISAEECGQTSLDGSFHLEAVEPGQYYAFASQEGYFNPERAIDLNRVNAKTSDNDQALELLDQWKDQLVLVTVRAHHATALNLSIHRAAEINGAVTFDDGPPAIGMRFRVLRKTAPKAWSSVGFTLFGDWAISSVTDSHGRYALTGLPAGEYIVCALMPVETESAAPQICLGNTLRRKNATTVKVADGDIAEGQDMVIPLTGLHNLSGKVDAAADGHPPTQATIHLLYADDREEARKTAMLKDGSFSFPYVAAEKYILQVTDAADKPEPDPQAKSPATRRYAVKEIPIMVQDEIDDIDLPLTEAPPETPPLATPPASQ